DPAQASMIIEKLILVDLLVDENLDDRRTSSEPPAPAGSTIRPHHRGRRTPEAGAGTFDNPPPPTAAHAPCRRPAGARHDPAPPTAQPGSAVRQPASQRSPAAQSGSQPAPAGCGAATRSARGRCPGRLAARPGRRPEWRRPGRTPG